MANKFKTTSNFRTRADQPFTERATVQKASGAQNLSLQALYLIWPA